MPAIVGDDTLNSIAYYLRLLVGFVEETQSLSIGRRQGVILIRLKHAKAPTPNGPCLYST